MIEIPNTASQILKALELGGYEAYVVGGCVRDSLLGKTPHDWDICTSAQPHETIACLSGYHTIETGIQHGTVTVVIGKNVCYEVTTFRQDSTYSDHRRPDRVEFVRSLREDLKRRDFTINAMAYHPQKGLIDAFDGQADLKRGVIRCVGEPARRFEEDALRILRALRFASVYEFSLEHETAQAATNLRHLLGSIAEERIRDELCKLLCGQNAGVMLSSFTSIFCEFLPELNGLLALNSKQSNQPNPWDATVQSVANAPAKPILRLAMLFHEIGKPFRFTRKIDGIPRYYGHAKKSAALARTILRRLRFDNASISKITQLIGLHETAVVPTEVCIRRQLSRLGSEQLRRLFQIKKALIASQPSDRKTDSLFVLEQAERTLNHILEQKQCYRLKNLAVTGRELIAAGMPQGAQIGKVLRTLLRLVIDGKLENRRECLLAYCQKEGWIAS